MKTVAWKPMALDVCRVLLMSPGNMEASAEAIPTQITGMIGEIWPIVDCHKQATKLIQ